MRPGWTQDDIYRISARGYSLHQQGRYREAAVIFDGLVAADPENDYCRDALAAACLALGERQRAVQELDTILERDSGHLAARARRFEAYLEMDDFAAAKADFDVLKRLQPAHEVRRLRLRLETAIRRTTISSDSR
jgi:tetratricopeptide (TPR) repeat protein